MTTTDLFINAFTRLAMDGVSLGEMQVANPRLTYSLDDRNSARAEIDIRVSVVRDQPLAREVFQSPMTGYFEKRGAFYYRNCNIANAVDKPEVFYKGRLPNSFLAMQIDSFDPVHVVIRATKPFIYESRSRLTRISSIDNAVNNIALACSVHRGYLPFHGAAVEVPMNGERRSLLFMGLPNTGKTSTSVALRKITNGEYLAEDICFVQEGSLKVLGGPFTLDETKLQNYDELRAVKYRGAPLGAIIMLQRTFGPSSSGLIAPGDPVVEDFLIDMNRYEFEWNHDNFVRHLMLGGASQGFSISAITKRYFAGLRRVAEQVPVIRLSGEDPTRWADLLVDQMKMLARI